MGVHVAEYIGVEEAKDLPGLRLVLTQGVPGPWGEAAKGMFHVKGIPFARVAQRGGQANAEIEAWTGRANAPQAVWQDEPARSGWAEIILLAERLEPEPRLLPAGAGERADLFGLAFLVAGEEGFGWQRRLMMLHPMLSLPEDALPADHPMRQVTQRLGGRYGYSAEAAAAAPGRAAAILRALSARLEAQKRAGSPYFLGDALSALDVLWAAFAALLKPLPEEQCPFAEMLRTQYTASDPLLLEAASPLLLEHRDFVYEKHLPLPLDF
jgi:glutathione S-transferase